ncbi:hypothetical protein MMC17_002555 [Xylographa soralifera]|nr:hypothetical protein [Xylographa soralifera]
MAEFEEAANTDDELLSLLSVVESDGSSTFEDAFEFQAPSVLNDENVQRKPVSSETHRQGHEQVIIYQPLMIHDTLVNVEPVTHAPSPPLTVPDYTSDTSSDSIENHEEVLESRAASYDNGSAGGGTGSSADSSESSEADREFADEIEKRRKNQGRALNLDRRTPRWDIGAQLQPRDSLTSSRQGMSDLVRDAFKHIKGLRPCVDRGRYDLLDSDNYIILPAAWESLVRPGWSLRIRLWPTTKRLQDLYKSQNGDSKSTYEYTADTIASANSSQRSVDIRDWTTISLNDANSDIVHQTGISDEDSQSISAESEAPEPDIFELEAYRSESADPGYRYHKTAHSEEATIAPDQERMRTSYARRAASEGSADTVELPATPSVPRDFFPPTATMIAYTAPEDDKNAHVERNSPKRLKPPRRENERIVLKKEQDIEIPNGVLSSTESEEDIGEDASKGKNSRTTFRTPSLPSLPFMSSSDERAETEPKTDFEIETVEDKRIFKQRKPENIDKTPQLIASSRPGVEGDTKSVVESVKHDMENNSTGSTSGRPSGSRVTMLAALEALSTSEQSDHKNEDAPVSIEQRWVSLHPQAPNAKERTTLRGESTVENRRSPILMSTHAARGSRHHSKRTKDAVKRGRSTAALSSSKAFSVAVESASDEDSSVEIVAATSDAPKVFESHKQQLNYTTELGIPRSHRSREPKLKSLGSEGRVRKPPQTKENHTQWPQLGSDPKFAPQVIGYDPQFVPNGFTPQPSQYTSQQFISPYQHQEYAPQYGYAPSPAPNGYVSNVWPNGYSLYSPDVFPNGYQQYPDQLRNAEESQGIRDADRSHAPVVKSRKSKAKLVNKRTTVAPLANGAFVADKSISNPVIRKPSPPSLVSSRRSIEQGQPANQRSGISVQSERRSKEPEEAFKDRRILQSIEDVFYYSSDTDRAEASGVEECPERTNKWKEIKPISHNELKDIRFTTRERYNANFRLEAQSNETRNKAQNAFSTGLLNIFPSISDHMKVWKDNGLENDGLIWELLLKDLMLALFTPTASRYWTMGLRSSQTDYQKSQFAGLMQTLQRLKSVHNKIGCKDEFVPTMIIMLIQLGLASQTMATWCHKKRSGYALDWPMWKLQNLCYRRHILKQPKAHETHDAQHHRDLIYAVFCAMNYRGNEVELISLSETRWTAVQANRSVGDVMMDTLEKRTTLYRDQSQISEPLFEASHLSVRALLEIGKIEVKWTFSFDEHLRLKNIANGKRVVYIFWDPSLLWIVHGCFDDLHKWPELVELKRTYAILFSPSRRGQSLRQTIISGAVSTDIEATAESKQFDFYTPLKESDINESYYLLPAPSSIPLPDDRLPKASVTMKDCPSYLQATRMHHEAVLTTNLNEMEEFGSYPYFGNRLREIQWYMDKSKPR